MSENTTEIKTETETVHEQVQEAVTGMVSNNISAIVQQLDEDAEGKVAFSLSIKLCKSANKVFLDGLISYAKRTKDDWESVVQIDDPNQMKLGVEV